MSNQFSLFEEPDKEVKEVEFQPPLFDGLEPKDVDWKQNTLFDIEPKWKELWQGMPEFKQEDQQAFQSINVHFRNREDRIKFAELVQQQITNQTQYIWFPKQEISDLISKRYVSNGAEKNPRYPVYVISKGRWESRLTSRALDAINVPYKIVIEPQEFEQYSEVIDPAKILQLPFSNLGQGSIPARNWVWEHSISVGARRHWILDDNIGAFSRLHNNAKIRVADGMIFRAAEDFADRYANVALAGFQYRFFAPQKAEIPPLYTNTRIYSCILIQNDIPYRWRGRYNEDTDLSIRALKDGWCTALFNAFLIDKAGTMTMKGGNTDELYKDDGRLQMAQSLKDQHPDIVSITEKWGRYQHHVDYRGFRRNKLILREGVDLSSNGDEYGLKLVENYDSARQSEIEEQLCSVEEQEEQGEQRETVEAIQ